jgi:hypothetical protein
MRSVCVGRVGDGARRHEQVVSVVATEFIGDTTKSCAEVAQEEPRGGCYLIYGDGLTPAESFVSVDAWGSSLRGSRFAEVMQ